MVQAEQHRQSENTAKAGQHPRDDAEENRLSVLLQEADLLVQQDSQTHSGRCQQITQILSAGVVGIVIDLEYEEEKR